MESRGEKDVLYFHGENDVTRLATNTDGVHFTYEAAEGRLYLFTNIGPRLNQRIALAVQETP